MRINSLKFFFAMFARALSSSSCRLEIEVLLSIYTIDIDVYHRIYIAEAPCELKSNNQTDEEGI